MEIDPYDALTAALVPSALASNEFKTSPARYYVLAVFALISALQGVVWCTFSTVPEYSNGYFNQPPSSQSLLDLFLSWGPIVYLPLIFVATWMQTWRQGLRHTVVLGAFLLFAATTLRLIPTFYDADVRAHNDFLVILVTHAAQIVNAAVGPLVLASPSKLSVTWFAEGERTFATALASISNPFGIGLAYLIAPFIVSAASDIVTIIRITFCAAAVAFLLPLLYFPNRPKLYPSAAAAHRHKNPSGMLSPLPSLSFAHGLCVTLKNRSFFAVVLAGGALTGVYTAWSAILPSVVGIYFTLNQSASFVSCTRFAGIIGGLWSGWLADRPMFRRRYKPLLCVFLYSAFVLLSMFFLCSPSFIFKTPILPTDYVISLLVVGFAGFALGACTPLWLELGAELTYPAPESTSAGLIILVQQIGTLVMLAVAPELAQNSDPTSRGVSTKPNANFIMSVVVLAALIVTFTVTEDYRRTRAGLQYTHRNEGVKAVLQYYAKLGEDDESAHASPSNQRAGLEPIRHSAYTNGMNAGASTSPVLHNAESGSERHSSFNGVPLSPGWLPITQETSNER